MSLPHTPELEKIKPFPTPPTLASPISSPLPQKVMAERPQKGKGLPPTPKTTPIAAGLMDSFQDGQVTDGQAAKMSIDRLTSGHAHTADFVPSWPATEHGSVVDAPASPNDSLESTGRYSQTESDAALILLQMACSQIERAVPQREIPPLGPIVPQSFERQAKRDPQHVAPSRTPRHTPHPIDGPTTSQQCKSTSTVLHKTNKRAGVAAYHNAKAKNDEAIERRRRGLASYDIRPQTLSSAGVASQIVKPPPEAKIGLPWIKMETTPQERAELITIQRREWDHFNRIRRPMVDAAKRIVARGNTPWHPWNVPLDLLNREVRRFETEQSELRKVEKPKSRPNARKSINKPPATAGSVKVTPGQIVKRRGAEVEDISSSDTENPVSQEESDYFDEPRAKKTKTTGGKTERSPKEQHDVYDVILPGETKTTVGKRKRSADEQARSSSGPFDKKRKTTTKRSGEGKPKNSKDKRLEDIKYWLCSKTKKTLPPKKSGDEVTPDHKSDWQALEFVRLPGLGSKIDTAKIDFDEKLGPKGDYRGGDPAGLHPNEQQVARLNNLTYDQYRCQKRRIFAARAVFDQIHTSEGLAPAWGRTQTQLVGSIDANKSSYLYSNFNNWGWFDTMHETWDDHYLDMLVADFHAYSRRPWTPPSEDGKLSGL
jgi:hypothetical protein